jgi:uncharacterized protein
MSIWERDYSHDEHTAVAAGSFARRVYSWLTLGLLTTALTAFGVMHFQLVPYLLPYWWVMLFGAMGVGMAVNAKMQSIAVPTMVGLLGLYSVLQGLFYGTILPLYAHQFGGDVIYLAFLTAGLVFGMSVLYGAFTKVDLTRFNKIVQMGLLGLITISVFYFIISLFRPLSGSMLLISYIGLIIFVAMTAMDAQQIRRLSYQVSDNSAMAQKLSLMVAFRMYINVIMIFWYLLQIFASNRRN